MIKLTLPGGNPTIINEKKIREMFHTDYNGKPATVIYFGGRHTTYVKQNMDEILTRIQNGG